MASTQILKARIRSVKSTKQITSAMQLVAASKMRRAQEGSKASAPYALAARELLSTLAKHHSVKDHPLFVARPVKSRLILVIASDKGLAGAYDNNILKLYAGQLQEDKKKGVSTKTIAIGRKAGQFATRIKDTEVIGFYDNVPDRPDKLGFRAIADTIRDEFLSEKVDAVDVIFTDFISSMHQEARVAHILPAGFRPTEVDNEMLDAVYEPNATEVIEAVAHRLVRAQVFQTFLDARASEHSMRMLAMKNATDNATDLIDDLTLAMNKARQAAITQEITEISAGVEALNE